MLGASHEQNSYRDRRGRQLCKLAGPGNQFLWRLSPQRGQRRPDAPAGRSLLAGRHRSRRRVRYRSPQGRDRCERGDFRSAKLHQGFLRKDGEERHDRQNGLRVRRSRLAHERVRSNSGRSNRWRRNRPGNGSSRSCGNPAPRSWSIICRSARRKRRAFMSAARSKPGLLWSITSRFSSRATRSGRSGSRKKIFRSSATTSKRSSGATVLHRTIVDLFRKRGVKIERTYQLNTGGNTDFLNMLNREPARLEEDFKDRSGSIGHRRAPGRREHSHRAERLRSLAERQQDLFHSGGGKTFRRCADGDRSQAFGRRFAQLRRSGDRLNPLLQAGARPRERRRAPFRRRPIFPNIRRFN